MRSRNWFESVSVKAATVSVRNGRARTARKESDKI